MTALFRRKTEREYWRSIPQAEFHIFAKGGHAVPRAPAEQLEYTTTVKEFLDK